jgi:glycosyltransferase involved in cell wall biosynthesis
VIHDHGLWLPTNHAAAATAQRLGIPLIVSPRGMLEPWAWRYKAWKKSLAWRLYQRRDLEGAAAFCCTSEMEGRNLRALGFRQPIAVIPNGVDLPPLECTSRCPSGGPSAERIALFLSRLHPKKGLLDLVKAWSIVRPAGWRVVIAGPDERGHRREVEAAISRAGLESVFAFAGPAADCEKSALFRQADLFVLPTLSENFGVVVAEALAHGVPVITTKAAPWQCLERDGGGWWIDGGPAPLADALRAATALSDAERAVIGARGRAIVEARCSWTRIADQMLDFYGWVAGSGGQPDCLAA